MNIEISGLLFQPCKIIPFEYLEGVITGLNQSRKGTELQVRYFSNGDYKTDWFFDFDIEAESSICTAEEYKAELERKEIHLQSSIETTDIYWQMLNKIWEIVNSHNKTEEQQKICNDIIKVMRIEECGNDR